MDSNIMTLWTYAYCVDCGCMTIGGAGHLKECNPSELFKAVFRAARYRAIQKLAKR